MITRAPLGIGYLSSYLKHAGHEFKLFDTTFIRCADCLSDDALREQNLQVANPDFEKLGLVERDVNVFEELRDEIESFQPDMIGMSTVDPNHNFGIELLNYSKKLYPEIPIVVGGALASLVPNDLIVEAPIDILAQGECEESLVDLCNRFESGRWEDSYTTPNFWIKDKNFKQNGVVHKNKTNLPDPTNGLAPDLGIYDPRHFLRPLGGRMYNMATVIWTRGCIFRCSYCANETFYKNANVSPGQYYRMKDTKALVKELEQFKKVFNLNFLMFVDDIWPMHEPKIVEEFRELYKKHVDLPFSVNLQCQLVKEECFDAAVDAGLRNICVGVESGSQRVRKEVLKRNYRDADVQRVFGYAHKHQIRCSSFNIIGLPFEERKDIFETIALNRTLKPHSATVTFFHPYRGAPLRKLCIEQGYIDEKDTKHEDVYRSDSQITMPQITKKDLKGIMQSFQLYMKLPEKYHKLIGLQEDQGAFGAKAIRENILLPKFHEVQNAEPQWDFRKKKEWWLGEKTEGLAVAESKLPATQAGDAGFMPIGKKPVAAGATADALKGHGDASGT